MMTLTRKFFFAGTLFLLVAFSLLSAQAQSENSVGIGDSVRGQLTSDVPSVSYTVSARAGDFLSFTESSSDFDSYLMLLGPDGAILASDDDGAGGKNARVEFTLTANGLYTIKVGSYNQVSTGAYTLTVEGIAAEASATPGLTVTSTPEASTPPSEGSISYGQTVEGTLAADILSIPYTFAGHQGDPLTITLSSPDFDAYLTLEDAEGSEVASDDDSAGSLNARIQVTLAADSTYTIRAGSASAGSSGSFTLELAQVSAEVVAATATPGAVSEPAFIVTTGALTGDILSARYTFDGHAGDSVSFTLNSTDFDSYLILQSPDGKTLAEDDDSAEGRNASIENYTLPADGTYTLIVSSNTRAETGRFTLEVVGASLQAQIVATPEPTLVVQTGGDIQVGVPVSGSLNSDHATASYTFTTTAADTVTITVTTNDFDSFVSLRDASGAELTNDDDGAGNLNSRIENYTLPGSGTYTIVVSAAGGVITGDFLLRVEEGSSVQPTAEPTTQPTTVAVGGALTIGQSLSGALAGDQFSADYTFTGEAGQAVTLTAASDDFDTFLTLKDSSGNIVATDDDSAGNLDARIENVTLPANDTYSIIISSFDNSGRGSFTVSLEAGSSVQPTAVPTHVPAGGELAIGTTTDGELQVGQATTTYTFQGEAGQAITIRLSSSAFDSYLRLQDASGLDLITDDDSGGNLDARIGPYTLPSNSTYTIVVESFNSNYGAYTLSLDATRIEAIEYGQTATGALENAGDSTIYRFHGSQGDALTIRLTSSDFDTSVTLSDSTAAVLASNDDGGGSGTNSFVGPYVLPASGDYFITVSSYDDSGIGSYTLTLIKATLTPLVYGDTKDVNFGDGVSAYYYSFEGKNGEVINVSVTSGGVVDTSLLLNGPDGSQIIFDDDGGAGFDPEIFHQILSQDGTYTLVFQAAVPGGSGQASLALTQSPVPSLDNGPVTIHLSSKATQDVVTFSGHAGELVRLTANIVSSDGATSPSLTVTQSGTDIASGSGTTVSGLVIEFTVPADGAVNVRISDYSYTNAAVLLSIMRITE